jgi:hypothetical protein
MAHDQCDVSGVGAHWSLLRIGNSAVQRGWQDWRRPEIELEGIPVLARNSSTALQGQAREFAGARSNCLGRQVYLSLIYKEPSPESEKEP